MTPNQYRFTSPSGSFNFTGPDFEEMRATARNLMDFKFGKGKWSEVLSGVYYTYSDVTNMAEKQIEIVETIFKDTMQTAAPQTKKLRFWFKSGYHEDYTIMADGDIVITNQGWLIFIDVHKNKYRFPPHVVEAIARIVEGDLYDEPMSPEKNSVRFEHG